MRIADTTSDGCQTEGSPFTTEVQEPGGQGLQMAPAICQGFMTV